MFFTSLLTVDLRGKNKLYNTTLINDGSYTGNDSNKITAVQGVKRMRCRPGSDVIQSPMM